MNIGNFGTHLSKLSVCNCNSCRRYQDSPLEIDMSLNQDISSPIDDLLLNEDIISGRYFDADVTDAAHSDAIDTWS